MWAECTFVRNIYVTKPPKYIKFNCYQPCSSTLLSYCITYQQEEALIWQTDININDTRLFTISTLIMKTEDISETSVFSSTLTRLIARKNFRDCIRRESFKHYIMLLTLFLSKCTCYANLNVSRKILLTARHSRKPKETHKPVQLDNVLAFTWTIIKYVNSCFSCSLHTAQASQRKRKLLY